MILVILGICIALVVVGIILSVKLSWELDWIGGFLMGIGAVVGIVALIVTIVLTICVSELYVIDEQITMYQEENAKIEEQIAATVEKYKQYETDVFNEVSPDSSITMVAHYPELKSDTLVQSQIEVYINNNEKIKSLKESKIAGSVYRWWLYFGG
jgi:uncharacterized membrane protein (DUF485 family)